MKIYRIATISSVEENELVFKLKQHFEMGWDKKQDHKQGEWMMINPDIRNSQCGRAWLIGWNAAALGKPRIAPDNLLELTSNKEFIPIQ